MGTGFHNNPPTLREEETAQLLPPPEISEKHTSSIPLNPHLSHRDVRELLISVQANIYDVELKLSKKLETYGNFICESMSFYKYDIVM